MQADIRRSFAKLPAICRETDRQFTAAAPQIHRE